MRRREMRLSFRAISARAVHLNEIDPPFRLQSIRAIRDARRHADELFAALNEKCRRHALGVFLADGIDDVEVLLILVEPK